MFVRMPALTMRAIRVCGVKSTNGSRLARVQRLKRRELPGTLLNRRVVKVRSRICPGECQHVGLEADRDFDMFR